MIEFFSEQTHEWHPATADVVMDDVEEMLAYPDGAFLAARFRAGPRGRWGYRFRAGAHVPADAGVAAGDAARYGLVTHPVGGWVAPSAPGKGDK